MPAVVEELDRWGFLRDTLRSMSLLFAMGYAFAMYVVHPNRFSP